MTGPIQPLPVPSVTPIYYSTDNPNQDRLQKSFQALLGVMSARQEIEAQKAKAAQQDAAGKLLGSFLGDLGRETIPQSSYTDPTTGAPVTVPGLTVEGPLAQFRGKPGQAVFDALRVGGGAVAQEVARVTDARTKKPVKDPFTAGEVDILPVGKDQHYVSFNKRTGKIVPLIGPDGKPLTKPKDDSAGPAGSFQQLEDEETGEVTYFNPTTRERVAAPKGYGKGGTITEAASRAAQLYRPAATAFQQLDKMGFGNLTGDQALLVFTALRGDAGAIKEATVRGLLTPQNRKLVALYAELVGNIAYGKSGANVNEREFATQRLLIPFLDDAEGRSVKRQVLLDNLTGLYSTGYRALQRDKRNGITWTPIESFYTKGADPVTGAKPLPGLTQEELDAIQ